MAALGSCYCFNCIVAQMKFYISTVLKMDVGMKLLSQLIAWFPHENAFYAEHMLKAMYAFIVYEFALINKTWFGNQLYLDVKKLNLKYRKKFQGWIMYK